MSWSKSVFDVIQGQVPNALDSDDVKAHRMGGIAAVSSNEQGGGADDFPLLVMVNGVARRAERCGCTITDFNKGQAISVEHYQVDFTTAATKVSGQRFKVSRE